MIKISPSILASDFANLEKEATLMKQAGAEMLHIDVMDGHFVPNITIGSCVVKSLRSKSDLIFDVHLMISNPIQYIDDFAKAGADIITFHIESDSDPIKTIEKIKQVGKKVGISIKPKTPAEDILHLLPYVDMVLVMTVEPGFGGQKFMADMLPKIELLKQEITSRQLDCDIQVDGGIDKNTVAFVAAAGANVYVAGSALFGQEDYKKGVEEIRNAAQKAL